MHNKTQLDRGHTCDTAAASNGCEEAPRTIRTAVDVIANYDFSAALRAAIGQDLRITRAGWNAQGQYVYVAASKVGSCYAPYLMLKNAQDTHVPWAPSQGDLFATDWAVLPR